MTEEQELTAAQVKALGKLKLDWDMAKDKRDQACTAAWELEDVEARRPAYDAAQAEWKAAKEQLLEREATIRGG